jgi:hypothetical protein
MAGFAQDSDDSAAPGRRLPKAGRKFFDLQQRAGGTRRRLVKIGATVGETVGIALNGATMVVSFPSAPW